MTATFSTEVLTDLVENFKGPSPQGITCTFKCIDDKWGIKIYRDKDVRDGCYDTQKEMAKYGLAPQVGECFIIGWKFCYVTEIAQPIIEGLSEDIKDPVVRSLYWAKFHALNIDPKIRQEMEDVALEMSDKGFHTDDIHAANYGYLNGKLVCIDFSH